MISRRKFIQHGGGAGLLGLLPGAAIAGSLTQAGRKEQHGIQLVQSLSGPWDFCLDSGNKGVDEKWFLSSVKGENWKQVCVPHTWQTDPEHAEYFGTAWYKKDFSVPAEWAGKTVRVEFESVYHSARVWLNGEPVGEHIRKGYTAFFIDLTKAIRFGAVNTLVVRANNTFDDQMLPRSHSYDWAADGGITRPVSLHVTEQNFASRADITAIPDLDKSNATIHVEAVLVNNNMRATSLETGYRIREEKSAVTVLHIPARPVELKAGESKTIRLPDAVLNDPLLWHFDHPHLYVLELELWKDGQLINTFTTTFGVRKIEARDAGFYLNGERVRIMGVERMGGSNPDFGMAEPSGWITHDHKDLKELNCVFTRAHWQQDKRVLDYCDRHGIFIQSEIPTWGALLLKT